MHARRRAGRRAGASLAWLAFCACGAEPAPATVSTADDPATADAGGARGAGFGNATQSAGNLDAGPRPLPECVSEVITADPVPVDMYIMLDRSGSMQERTGTGESKWDAIRGALASFVNDARSSGLGVGLQYFPLATPGVPESCRSDAECGPGGPCLTLACMPPPVGTFSFTLCLDGSDCPRLSPGCAPFGVCDGDPSLACFDLGPGGCGGSGDCDPPPSECLRYASCDVAQYATPAVEIMPLPGAASALVDSLVAQNAIGLTPTSAALAGAIAQARDHALAQPGHRVLTVLATDGTPTECEPTDSAGVARIGEDGVAGDPSIRTYVIGIFGPSDTGAIENLREWALGGGSRAPLVVDPSTDVAAQFLDALEEIRNGTLACEFRLPESPEDSALDLGFVNVAVVERGRTRDLRYVGEQARCDEAALGWHYDEDPEQGEPTKIVVCPRACDLIEQTSGVRVELRLGCQTLGPD